MRPSTTALPQAPQIESKRRQWATISSCPVCFETSIIRRQSATVRAIGFSVITGLPARMASMAVPLWNSVGVTTTTASISGSASISRWSAYSFMPGTRSAASSRASSEGSAPARRRQPRSGSNADIWLRDMPPRPMNPRLIMVAFPSRLISVPERSDRRSGRHSSFRSGRQSSSGRRGGPERRRRPVFKLSDESFRQGRVHHSGPAPEVCSCRQPDRLPDRSLEDLARWCRPAAATGHPPGPRFAACMVCEGSPPGPAAAPATRPPPGT